MQAIGVWQFEAAFLQGVLHVLPQLCAPVSRTTGGIAEFVKRRWLVRLSAKVDGVENAAAYALLPQSVIDTDAEATDIYVQLLRLVLSNNFLNPTGHLHGVHMPA